MNKKYIIIIVFIIIYIIIAVILGIISEGEKKYIVFFDDKNLKYDKKWSIMSKNIPNLSFNIVKDGIVDSNSIINMHSDLADEAAINKNIFAYRGNIKVKPYKKSDVTDNAFIDKILTENNLNVNSNDISRKYQYNLDINNDGLDETIYVLSNTDISLGNLFSMVIVKNMENYVIIDIKRFDSEFGTYFPCLYFMDVDNDNNLEIILKKIYASNAGQKISILKINKEINNYSIVFRED